MPEGITGDIPVIVADIKKELSAIGANSKTAVENLTKTHDDFKKIHTEAVQKGEAELGEVKAKLASFMTDIATRVDVMDKKANERIDGFETRFGGSQWGSMNEGDNKDLGREAMQFKEIQLSRRDPGFNRADMKTINPADFLNYKDAFDRFIRKSDQHGMGISELQLKALVTGSDPAGGYIVPPSISGRVITKLYESTPMRALSTIETIGTDSYLADTDLDEAGANWVGETETRAETTTPAIGKKSIVVHEIQAMPKASQNNLDDSAWNIEQWLTRKLTDKFGRTEANAFVVGNGVAKPRGFTTYANGTTWGTIEQIASGVIYSTTPCYTYASLINTMTALKEGYLANATWMASRVSIKHLLLIVDPIGQYIFAPTLMGGPGGTRIFSPNLLGFPMRLAADMPTLAASSLSMAFGDFRTGYTIVDRNGMRIQRNPYKSSPWVYFEAFRRVGGDVTNFEAIKLVRVAVT